MNNQFGMLMLADYPARINGFNLGPIVTVGAGCTTSFHVPTTMRSMNDMM